MITTRSAVFHTAGTHADEVRSNVSLRGARAQDLIAEVLLRLDPWLPPGVRVEMTRHEKWLSLQRSAPGGQRVGPLIVTPGADGQSGHGGVTGVPGVGPWIPFLPNRLRAKLTAQDAVETVLDVAYDTGPGARPDSTDFAVQARVDGDVVRVSYLPPGGIEPDQRIEIDPIPMTLL
jgi:hypothetical protein